MDNDAFAHIVSHDLKGPLNGINSMVGFIVEDYYDRIDDAGREQLDLIQKLAARGVAMVDALRDYSKVSRAAVEAVVLEPGMLAAQAMTAAELRRGGQSTTALRIAPGLPPVLGDPALLVMLFERLMTNAMLFNDKSERWIEVGHSDGGPAAEVPPDHAVLCVRDNGIGIPHNYKHLVFEMFQRLHGPDAFGGGVGAGLAIAQTIVNRHGGSMWVDSVEGQGSAFYLTLPRFAAAHDSERPAGT